MAAPLNRQLAESTYAAWSPALESLLPAAPWHLLVAVSGGCDSVFLGWLCAHAARRGAGRVHFAHVHHQLRAAADEEARFVTALGQAWGVAVETLVVDPRRAAREQGWSLEEAGRILRRRTLIDACRHLRCDHLALGHHQDDQAETMLLRLLRGSGPRGLGAMAPRVRARSPAAPRPDGSARAPLWLIRPLLDRRRTEIAAAAGRLGLDWRHDHSNRDRRFWRNRIRHELIPRLEADYNPRLVPALAELARQQRAESRAVSAAAAALWRRTRLAPPPDGRPETILLRARPLAGAPRAVASRLLYHAYQRLAGSDRALDRRHVAALLALAGCAGPQPQLPREVHLPGAIRARRRRGRIQFEHHAPRPGKDARG